MHGGGGRGGVRWAGRFAFLFKRYSSLEEGGREVTPACADAGTPTPSASLRRSLVHSASSAPRRLDSDTQPGCLHHMRMPRGGYGALQALLI